MENKFLLLNLSILLLLLAVSIWDTIKLTKEYLYNNRQTLVRPEYANDTYPFLRDVRLQIQIEYDQVMFPELWPATLESDWDDQLDRYSEMAQNFSIDFDPHQIQSKWFNKTWNGDQKMTVGKFLEGIADMDDTFIKCLLISDLCEEIKNRDYSHLDKPLKNYSIVEKLENKLWRSEGFTTSYSTWSPSGFSVSDVSPESALIELNVFALLSKKETVAEIYTGFYVRSSFLGENSANFTGSVNLQDSSMVFPRSPIFSFDRESTLTQIKLSISNMAMFDKRQTTTCTEEPTLVFRPSLGSSECQVRNFFIALAEKCQCIPHSYRKEYARLSAKYSNFLRLPRCDAEIYESCREEMTKIDFTSLDCDPPKCVVVKNQYTYFVEEDTNTNICEINVGDGNDTCAPIQVFVQVMDNFYAYYEDQFQFTSAQFFSQLGGDWGLYTGINILGVWQLLLFLYQKYRDRRSDRSISPESGPSQKDAAVKSDWHHAATKSSSTEPNESVSPWWKDFRNEINGFMGLKSGDDDMPESEVGIREILLELKELRRDVEKIRLRVDKIDIGAPKDKKDLDQKASRGKKTQRIIESRL